MKIRIELILVGHEPLVLPITLFHIIVGIRIELILVGHEPLVLPVTLSHMSLV